MLRRRPAPAVDFLTWWHSLTDVEQERVLLCVREVAQAILVAHVQHVLAGNTAAAVGLRPAINLADPATAN